MASLPENYQALTSCAVETPQFTNDGTGVGAALFGANCPAGILTSPYRWVRVKVADGSVGWIPVWK